MYSNILLKKRNEPSQEIFVNKSDVTYFKYLNNFIVFFCIYVIFCLFIFVGTSRSRKLEGEIKNVETKPSPSKCLLFLLANHPDFQIFLGP